MPDIMHHRDGKQGVSFLLLKFFGGLMLKVPQDFLHTVENAQRVRKTRMCRSRVDQIADAELVDVPKPLHLRRVQQVQKPAVFAINGNVIVDRIPDYLLFHAHPFGDHACDGAN